MAWTITATFQSQTYITCHTAFLKPFREQIDIAGIGFRRDDGTNTIVVFPTQDRARQWGNIWFEHNKRVKPGLSKSFFALNEVTIT